MWQAATFSPKRIDTELGWAESIGMNTMRVFLHDLLWKQDSDGFKKRIDTFLTIANKHHIKPMFVLFDSCWDPLPKLGPQREPRPGVHNSGWMQSPGGAALQDESQYPRLRAYVEGVVGAFAMTTAFWPGTFGTNPTTRTRHRTVSRRTKRNWFRLYCLGCTPGRAAYNPSNR